MNCSKRNVILTPDGYDGEARQKGIVTFDCYQTETHGVLRCYNIFEKEDKYIFGVTVNDKLYKFDVTQKYSIFSFYLPCSIGSKDKISCVLVDLNGKNFSTIMMGSTETSEIFCKECIRQMQETETKKTANKEIDIDKTENKNVEKTYTYSNTLFDLYTKQQSENLMQENADNDTISQNENRIKCDVEQEDNSQKSKILSEQKALDNYIDTLLLQDDFQTERQEPNLEDVKQPKFYAKIKNQVDLLFQQNIRDSALEDILPESEFVKIANCNTGDYYVFGLIKEGGSVKYICYGVPAKNIDDKPFNMDNFYQWLPLDVDNPEGVGYYLAYQDAESGDNVKMTII